MRTFRFLAVAAVAAAAALTATPAAAAEPPAGQPCFAVAVQWEPVTGPTVWQGVVWGGPVAVAGETVTLTCTVHVFGGSPGDPPAAGASDTGPSVAVVPPTPVTWVDPYDYGYVAVCSAVTAGSTTWYWTDAGWVTDPPPWSSCSREYPDVPPAADPVLDLVDCTLSPYCGPWLDELVCDLLADREGVPGVVEIREDGDVYVLGEFIWDCPPYAPQ